MQINSTNEQAPNSIQDSKKCLNADSCRHEQFEFNLLKPLWHRPEPGNSSCGETYECEIMVLISVM